MSTYYYFYADKQHEFFELTSGSWYHYMEDLYDVLTACTSAKKSYKYFIKKLQDNDVFQDFYDNGSDFITEDNEKYFLRPLYDWAYDKDIRLIDDYTFYDLEVRALCEKNNVKYEKKNSWDYTFEIAKLIKDCRQELRDSDYDSYFKCVGKLNYDDKIMADIGVNFERAISELKAGAIVWRKTHEKTEAPECFRKFVFDNRKNEILILMNGNVLKAIDYASLFTQEDILSNDWTYEYTTKENNNESHISL